MSKGEPAANIPHLVFPSVVFYKDLRLAAQKGESTYLIRAILFLFLITYSTSHVLMLMSYSVSAHLASSFSFPHINSPHHRELLFLSTEEQEDKRYKKIIKINPGCEKVSGPEPESRKHVGDRLASPRSGRSANRRGGKSVYRDSFFRVQSTQCDVN